MIRKLLDYKVFLSGFLVFTILCAAIPTNAFAQTPTAGSKGYSYTGTSGSAGADSLSSLVVDTTGAIVTAQINCRKDEIKSAIKDLFTPSSSIVSEGSKLGTKAITGAISGSSNEGSTGSTAGTDQAVHFESQSPDSQNLTAVANATQAETKKITCGRATEKAIAGVILRQITISTVNWINHGMNGNPFYTTDTGASLRALRDQSIKDLNSVIGLDNKNYPFGRTIAQNLTNQMKSAYEQSARYSLNAVIAQQYPGRTGVDFNRDFSIGGWSAFLAQTFMNNNPIGFDFMTQSELARRTADTYYSPAQDIRDQLARSGGFFDQRICVQKDPNDSTGKRCLRNQVQTPGSVIAHALTKNLDTTNDQLINGQDLSVDITAIFDALTNQLINKGLTSLSTNDSSNLNNFSNNTNGVPTIPGVVVDNNPNGSWANQNTAFNLFTDIPQIMRLEDNTRSATNLQSGCPSDTGFDPNGQFCNGNPKLPLGYQQILSKEIEEQSKAIDSIYMLDYCVPGPHPGWENEIEANAQNFVSNPNTFPKSSSKSDMKKFFSTYGSTVGTVTGLVAGAALGTVVLPVIGTAIGAVIGLLIGTVLSVIGNDTNTENEQAYGPVMQGLLGLQFEFNSDGAGREHLNGHDPSANIITTFAHRYKEAAHMVYAPTENEVIQANLAKTKDDQNVRGGTIVGGSSSFTSTYTGGTVATPQIPDLSTSNKARADIMQTGYTALQNMSDVISTDNAEFQNAQSYRDNISQKKANLETSHAIERQLLSLLKRIDLLPTLSGYPGPTGSLDLVPTISLNGDKVVTVNQDDTYTDAGATAKDTTDGDITNKIITTNNVDTATPGIYTITYDVINKAGITANQVTRTVRVLDPNNSVLPDIQNYAVKNEPFSKTNLLPDIGTLDGSGTGSTPIRDYNKDLLAIKNMRDISSFTDYELELRAINNIFSQIAPYIHGVDDLNSEQAVLDTMMLSSNNIATFDKTTGELTGGVLNQCIKTTTKPGYKGPTARKLFAYLASNDGTIKKLPEWLTTKLPPSQSFLPDWHFAQGNGQQLDGKNWFPGDGEPAYPPDIQGKQFTFHNYNGNTMKLNGGTMIVEVNGPVSLDDDKLIRNDDVVNMTWQPVINAMKGIENLTGMY